MIIIIPGWHLAMEVLWFALTYPRLGSRAFSLDANCGGITILIQIIFKFFPEHILLI